MPLQTQVGTSEGSFAVEMPNAVCETRPVFEQRENISSHRHQTRGSTDDPADSCEGNVARNLVDYHTATIYAAYTHHPSVLPTAPTACGSLAKPSPRYTKARSFAKMLSPALKATCNSSLPSPSDMNLVAISAFLESPFLNNTAKPRRPLSPANGTRVGHVAAKKAPRDLVDCVRVVQQWTGLEQRSAAAGARLPRGHVNGNPPQGVRACGVPSVEDTGGKLCGWESTDLCKHFFFVCVGSVIYLSAVA